MRRRSFLVWFPGLMVLATALAPAGCHRRPALETLSPATLHDVGDAFDAARGRRRVLALFSPT